GTWDVYLAHAPGFDRVSPDLAGHAGLAATAAVLAVYALATTVQAGLFLAAIFEMPLGAVLLIGALWRIPTAAALGASGLSIAIAIWGGEAPVLLVPLVIASLIALLFTSHRQDLREAAALHEALTDLLATHDLDDLLSRLPRRPGAGRPDCPPAGGRRPGRPHHRHEAHPRLLYRVPGTRGLHLRRPGRAGGEQRPAVHEVPRGPDPGGSAEGDLGAHQLAEGSPGGLRHDRRLDARGAQGGSLRPVSRRARQGDHTHLRPRAGGR